MQKAARIVLTALTLTLALGAPGCVAEPEVGLDTEDVRVPGPWVLPRATREAGEAQYVAYDGAPPWDGGAHCSGRLMDGTRELGDYLLRRFRQLRTYGGYVCRQNTADLSRMSVHGTGRALDLMLPTISGDADNTAGDEIANWLVENAETIGVQYIIWDHWDWLGSLSGRKDTSYGGPIPHVDHLHVELTVEASRRNTPWFSDRDRDGIRNDRDNCPTEANPGQDDGDGDGVGNRCDNCVRDPNGGQADTDGDGLGDRCDNCARVDNPMQEDSDADGRGNRCDNCDAVANPNQRDTDGDGRGDACDGDDDGDGIADDADNCRLVANEGQRDTDGDGHGDRCEDDDDGDGIRDLRDNCVQVANADQVDADRDGEGDACDDRDGDSVRDTVDNCPDERNPGQRDDDADGIGNACDATSGAPTGMGGGVDECAMSIDADGDGLPDACDLDADGDAVLDDVDTCLGLPNPEQTDSDADGIGDACDPEPMTSDLPDPGPAHEEETIMEETTSEPGTAPTPSEDPASEGASPSLPGATGTRGSAHCSASAGQSTSSGLGLLVAASLALFFRRR